MHRNKWKRYGMALIAVMLAMFFVAAGWSKVIHPEKHIESFVRWGYSEWFVYFTGFVEIVGTGFLLVPRVRLYGAALLGVTMTGAAFTHFNAGETQAVLVPVVLWFILGMVGTLSWKRAG